MNFSIITPSFRHSNWLKLCLASVTDQQGVELEPIAQDSCSDDNLCLSPGATKEFKETLALPAGWVRALKPLWITHHRLRRLAAGHFSLKPASYAIYTRQSLEQRVRFDVPKPTAVWWNRL